MRKNNDNTNAFLIHICGFGGYLYPFGSIITPLIAWQTLKNRSTFLDEQGKEAVNFNISFALYQLIFSMFFVPFALGTFFRNINNNSNFEWFEFNFDLDSESFFGFLGFGSVMGLMMIIRIILIIMAALKAKEGENYKYPLTIKFIK
ncbi:MAG: DUF4870 domain-containing protein [Flavobacteriia bacterium]|nr:DUF4870 domain-containing protein [Flavobacteriia bacterium]OIP46821.1 MAG: hypothetical protein AUK46_07185 [Flavobacteriaceae bacterium CG2_30_31_66]PIV96368.1 MAG: DUF4870 domain-containing protein [Flavobacteriaceae bacterium CG17_big_fil_post_rev_8_21_14_2_50_31_13]PIX12039.1 MAG: DUF4870 domain-containing protein [Flavobacteriaceae bacterium CG_4_8_14_3_um_filter_31_8]PIY15510.1 MAG: DUF4870 domain-containing protein [Flavobacteriaceae bacterium CG_4_10_14_3_um_filter_31_253]PIZ11693.